MNEYEAKLAARRERLETAAANAHSEAAHHFTRVDLSVLPPGQPVLVGHYSERGHRNLLAKADNAIRAGLASNERAAELARRAAAVGTGGISSDDPEALDKLREKLARLQYMQQKMKAANAAFKKQLKAGTVPPFSGESALNVLESAREGDTTLIDAWQGRPFPTWATTNNGSEIRRLTKRIEELEASSAREPAGPEQFGDVSIFEDDNRTCVVFPGKPSETIRTSLKRNGFKWSPTREAWVRRAGDDSLYLARQIATSAVGT